MDVNEITTIELASEFSKNQNLFLVDVREAVERNISVLPDHLHIPIDELEGGIMEAMLKGGIQKLNEAGCALIGGETAEMPGMYPAGEYDLAGFAVGAVEKSKILSAQNVQAGDVVLGLGQRHAHDADGPRDGVEPGVVDHLDDGLLVVGDLLVAAFGHGSSFGSVAKLD